MKTTPLRAQDLRDKAVLTVAQFNPLLLSRMPKKVRIRVVGNTGAHVQVQHVGNHIHLKMLTEYRLPAAIKPEAIKSFVEIANSTLIAAARLLSRWRKPIYEDVKNGMIAVRISHRCTGEQALARLSNAEKELIACADELLTLLTTGISRQPSSDTEW